LSTLLVAVAAGAAVWQFGPLDLSALTAPTRPAAAPPPVAAPAPAQALPAEAAPSREAASAAVPAARSTEATEATEAGEVLPSATQVRALDVHVPIGGESESRPAPRAARAVKSEPAPPPTQDAVADTPGNPTLASASPAEQCRGRVMLAWYRCIRRACQAAPQFADAHECQRVRQIEIENARPRASQQ
jgi:hypothetical protein